LVSGETGFVDTGKAAANDADFWGPKDSPAPIVGGLDLSKVDVLTIKDARKLEGENKGLIFVQEPQGDFSKPFVKFEAGTTGAFSDVLSQRKAVSVIRFDNPNPNGNNFVKFDGVEDFNGITLIDRKTALTSFDKQIQSVQRVSNALRQNPGIKAVFEFPSQKAAGRATNILIQQNIRNITVRVAP
jgi:filamentous hemagglutinin